MSSADQSNRAPQPSHDRPLHWAGISDGLSITVGADRKSLTVGAGLALDAEGHDLHVEAPRTLAPSPENGSRQDVCILPAEPPDIQAIPSDQVPPEALVVAELDLAQDGTISAVRTDGRQDDGMRSKKRPGGGGAGPPLPLAWNWFENLTVRSNLAVGRSLAVGVAPDTTGPQKLNINEGGIGFTGPGLNAADKKLWSPADGLLRWQTHDSADAHALEVGHLQGTAAVHLDTHGSSWLTGGNLGIGTANPTEQLEVAGTIKATGSVIADQGILAWGICLGRAGSCPPYEYDYETVGVTDPRSNLRLKSPHAVLLHAPEDVIVSSSNGSGNLRVEGSVGVGFTAREMGPQRLNVNDGGIGFTGAGLNAADKKLWSPADGLLRWQTHDSAGAHALEVGHLQDTAAVHLDTCGNSWLTGGNLGVGTDKPGVKLEIRGGTSDATTAALRVTDSSGSSLLEVRNDGAIFFKDGAGSLRTPEGVEFQTVCCGQVAPDGTVLQGEGFEVTPLAPRMGLYELTFNPPFRSKPIVLLNGHGVPDFTGYAIPRGTDSVTIHDACSRLDGQPNGFYFIAIG